jgi:hypothetical protein
MKRKNRNGTNQAEPSILDWLNSNPDALDYTIEFTEQVPISLTAEEWLAVAQTAKVRKMSIGDVISGTLPSAVCDLQNEYLSAVAAEKRVAEAREAEGGAQ